MQSGNNRDPRRRSRYEGERLPVYNARQQNPYSNPSPQQNRYPVPDNRQISRMQSPPGTQSNHSGQGQYRPYSPPYQSRPQSPQPRQAVNHHSGTARPDPRRVYPERDLHVSRSRVSSPKPQSSQVRVTQYRRKRKNYTLHDFMLGLGIGLATFGTAAIFVVRAILELIS